MNAGLPGSSISREVTVKNEGNVPFRYVLTTSGGTGLLWTGTDTLDDSSSDGLQLRMSRGGVVLYEGPLKVQNFDFAVLVGPGQTDVVLFKVYLPDTAGNEFQGLSTSVTFSWTAIG